MIDRDLAELYGVATKALNQAVRRNEKRFPPDFVFQLNTNEKDELVTNCDRFKLLKHSSSSPYAFTEQGVAMLSSVLNSDKAIEVNVLIMRAFVRRSPVSFLWSTYCQVIVNQSIFNCQAIDNLTVFSLFIALFGYPAFPKQ
jgi:hypothetical protein